MSQKGQQQTLAPQQNAVETRPGVAHNVKAVAASSRVFGGDTLLKQM
jgi:hypothetical protein